MTKKMKTIFLIGGFTLFIIIAVVAYNFLSDKVTTKNNIDISNSQGDILNGSQKKKAPDFTVIDSDGKSAKLSDMIGKPIVLNFWASWCPPCKSEMPEFEILYKEFGNDVTFMMVDLVDGSGRETKEKGAKYIKDQGFSFSVYFDTKQEGSNEYIKKYIPATFFIDKDGYIVTSTEGQIDEKNLRKGIDLIK